MVKNTKEAIQRLRDVVSESNTNFGSRFLERLRLSIIRANICKSRSSNHEIQCNLSRLHTHKRDFTHIIESKSSSFARFNDRLYYRRKERVQELQHHLPIKIVVFVLL